MHNPIERHLRRGSSTVRSLVLAVSSMAIVAVLFVIYQYSTGIATPVVPQVATEEKPPPPITPDDADTKTVSVGDAKIGGGERITIRLYEARGNRARIELDVDAWEPTGPRGDEFKLTDPRIRLRTPDGQRVRITANEGWVNLVRGGGDAYQAQSGRLVGDVRFTIDRLTEAERQQLPPDQRDEPSEDRLIHIQFDEILFDVQDGRLETAGPFRLAMSEAQLEGIGLVVRYNEIDSRVERFEIADGGTATIKGASQIFDVSLPGGQQSVVQPTAAPEQEQPADQQLVAAAFTGQDTIADARDDIPLFIPDQPNKPRLRPNQTYVVDIDGGIIVQQFQGDKPMWRLTGDTFNVLFDFGQLQRNAARQGRSPLDDPAAPTTSLPEQPADDATSTDRIVFAWSGPLLLQPLYDEQLAEGETIGKRLRLIATGKPVDFSGPQGGISCHRLEVHRDADRIWATGTVEDPVVLNSAQCQELVATKLFIDRHEGIARITGPARLSEFSDLLHDPSKPDGQSGLALGGMNVRFDEVADFTMDVQIDRRIDPETDEIQDVRTEYISAATFVGNVKMEQGGDIVSGDQIKMVFDPPHTAGAFAEGIRSLEAVGRVVMIRGEDQITCDDLSVSFAPDPDGRARPRIADALGDVVITQGTRTFTARDRMTIEMIPIIKDKPPFDLVAARIESIKRGLDPATIDWDLVRSNYEQKTDYTTGLERVVAEGDVTAFDPVDGLDIQADSLACTFVDGKTIDIAKVVGSQDAPAHVQMGDFSITAQQIDIDGLQQRVDVHGPGRLTFAALQGLDGKRSETPQQVAISWTKEMTVRGADNIALFYGQVHAVSTRQIEPPPTLLSQLGLTHPPATLEHSTIDCGELVIDFADAPEKLATGATLEKDEWWLLEPLVAAIRKAPARSPALQLNKQPIRLVASKNVVTLFSNTDAQFGGLKNRVRLDAASVTVDLVEDLLTIPNRGTLLIEDYPAAAALQRGPAPSGGMLGASDAHLASQTYIEWAGSMSFDFGRLAADFNGGVFLDRRSGVKLALAGELLGDTKLDPQTMQQGGRQTQLRCDRLLAEFGRTETPPSRNERSAGRLSANDIRQFDALGGVYLTDDDLIIQAHHITKFNESHLLRITGNESQQAEIYSQTNSIPWFQGPEFTYNIATGEIEATNLQVRSR